MADSRPTSYTICLDISDACNLSCDYCFNKNKSGRLINPNEAIKALNVFFSCFPGGEKYFVDMSGKGEPLLALKTILTIAEWCHHKQDEIGREILPQFVCNGTLLTKEIADVLQSHGILFGISIDGAKRVHDAHRKTMEGKGTYDLAISHIANIENRDYIGCAATLTKNVFSLVGSIRTLSPYFKTISYRPVRGPDSFDLASERLWEIEYDRLTRELISEASENNDSTFLRLMNGEDYFGRFLCRAFGNQRVFNRCDGGSTRFAYDIDGHVYPCPASSEEGELAISNPSADFVKETLAQQANACLGCDFKFICGGECPLEKRQNGGKPNHVLCLFRQHLILLAFYIEETCFHINNKLFWELYSFVNEKNAREREDPKLRDFLNKHPNLTFTKGKLAFDESNKRY